MSDDSENIITPATQSGIAPADAKLRPAWPLWKRLLAYAILLAIAIASILCIDARVHHV